MKFEQKWIGTYTDNGKCGEYFDVSVPGNIQLDYARAHSGKIQGVGGLRLDL